MRQRGTEPGLFEATSLADAAGSPETQTCDSIYRLKSQKFSPAVCRIIPPKGRQPWLFSEPVMELVDEPGFLEEANKIIQESQSLEHVEI